MELKKLSRKFTRFERQKLGVVVLAGCFLASMTFVALPKPRTVPPPTFGLPLTAITDGDTLNSQKSVSLPLTSIVDEDTLNSQHSVSLPLTSIVDEDTLNSQHSENMTRENATQGRNPTPRCDVGDLRSGLCEKNDAARMSGNSSTISLTFSGREDSSTNLQSGRENEKQVVRKTCEPNSDQCGTSGDVMPANSSSSTTIDSTWMINTSNSNESTSKGRKPLCDVSDRRSDLCEMDGDIRIHGNSSSVTFVPSYQESSNSEKNNSWRIRPYARKGDNIALSNVREVVITTSNGETAQCTRKHNAPAVVFSLGGYTGNIFHDFTDIIVPLFLTAYRFHGEVQLLATDLNIYWIHKYALLFRKLSRYPVIDFNKDNNVHCFPQATVGLRCHKEFSIDPSRAPNGYTMLDFTRFMRSSYSLPRETPIRLRESPSKKPRLLIISRKRTRAFLNVDEIVREAEGTGYEVVVAEANVSSNVSSFAQIVNSCDVMMGVHGAGLTNLVYLPTNATLIQVVPWGRLEGIAMLDFGIPAKDMGLNYLQYSISEEETTLIETYPRDHPVFKDPASFHKGWLVLRKTFMDSQNVKLDVVRFRDVLLKAFDHFQ